jgi:hypothetical protein
MISIAQNYLLPEQPLTDRSAQEMPWHAAKKSIYIGKRTAFLPHGRFDQGENLTDD